MNGNEKKAETMEAPYQYTVKKNKATRIAYRMVGVCFVALSAAFFWLAVKLSAGMGGRMFKLAFGLALFAYGCMLVKASFRKSAYDLTYVFSEDELLIRRKKSDDHVPYEKITSVNLVIPTPELSYYVLKIDVGKEQFVLPFTGKRDLCDAIYLHLLKKTGIYREEEPETET